jgi:hypothetical protein
VVEWLMKFILPLLIGLSLCSLAASAQIFQIAEMNAGTMRNIIQTEYDLPIGSSYLDGLFFAPPSTTVVLQKDGQEELSLTTTSAENANFSINSFKFPNPYIDGTPYTLAIKSASTGQTCKVEKGARGTIGLSPGFVRIGCDFNYELLSRKH